jgi:hypothetical protein
MRFATLFAALAFACPAFAQPLTTAFTYQGELTDGAAPANGTYDLRFALYDSESGGNQIGPLLCVDDLAITNGRFTVQLDFGSVFDGQQRYLEIMVRADAGWNCDNSSGFTTLSPRMSLTAAPVASFALAAASSTTLNGQPATFYTNASNLTSGTIPSARLSGTYSSIVSFSNPSNIFAGNGTGLTNLNASNITGGVLSPARGGTGMNTSNAFAGQVLKWNGTVWAPGIDEDTTYAAGSGLIRNGNVFFIATGGVTTTHVADNAITAAKLALDPASLSKVTGGVLSVSLANVIAEGSITANQFIYTNPAHSTYTIPAAAFVACDGVPTFYSLGGASPTSSAPGGLIAPIRLPEGRRHHGRALLRLRSEHHLESELLHSGADTVQRY